MALVSETRATVFTEQTSATEEATLIVSTVGTVPTEIMKNMLKKCRKNLQVSDKTTTFAHAFEKQCLAIRAIPLEGWVSG